MMPKLQHLVMWGCEELTDVGVAALEPLSNRLRELNLLDCKLLTDQSLITISRTLPKLQDLTIGSSNLTGIGADALSNMARLNHLTLLASNLDSFASSKNKLAHLKRCQIGPLWL
jgi:F-box and leucine-rich repeat protein 14